MVPGPDRFRPVSTGQPGAIPKTLVDASAEGRKVTFTLDAQGRVVEEVLDPALTPSR